MKTTTMDEIRASRTGISEATLDAAYQDALAQLPLAALRSECGITQSAMAELLGKSQAAVSRFEGRGDFLLSTLYRHVKAMGANLELQIRTEASKYELRANEFDGEVTFALVKSHGLGSSDAACDVQAYVNQFRGAKAYGAKSFGKAAQLWTRRGNSAEEINVDIRSERAANDEAKSAAA